MGDSTKERVYRTERLAANGDAHHSKDRARERANGPRLRDCAAVRAITKRAPALCGWGVLTVLAGCKDPCSDGVMAWTEDGTTWGGEADTGDPDDIRSETMSLGDGDVVNVCPGVWDVQLTVVTEGSEASLLGAGSDTTTFDGGGSGRTVAAYGDGHLLVRGVTVRGGYVGWYEGEDGETVIGRAGGFGAGLARITLEAVSIEDNRSIHGGGLSLAPDTSLTIRESRIVRNTAEAGGGAALPYEGTELISENTDWGSGEDDNAPDDIVITDTDGGEVFAGYSFGPDASFTCTWDSRECE